MTLAGVEVRLRVKLELLIAPAIVRPIAPPRYSETIASELAMATSVILIYGISTDTDIDSDKYYRRKILQSELQ